MAELEVSADGTVSEVESSSDEQKTNSNEIKFNTQLFDGRYGIAKSDSDKISPEKDDKLIKNQSSLSSISLKSDGNISITSSFFNFFKSDADGQKIEAGFHKKAIFNRFEFEVDEVVINKHKLNPYLYELTDFKQITTPISGIIGNLCIDGTVLVKAWDSTLKKYVLIRRRIRTPMFFPRLNVPEIPSGLGIFDQTALDTSSLAVKGDTYTLDQYRASEIGKQNLSASKGSDDPLSQNTDALGDLKNQANEAVGAIVEKQADKFLGKLA